MAYKMDMEIRKYKGYTVEIWLDEDAENPREWDNLVKMVCFHKRYALGDQHHSSPEDFREFVRREKPVVVLPLYLYDHSVLSISTKSFMGRVRHAEWDSGQVGWAYISKEDALKEYEVKRISKKIRAELRAVLESEVEVYDQFLQGEVYGFTIRDAGGNEVESVGGYFGDPGKYLMDEVRRIVDNRGAYALPYEGKETYEDMGW